MKKLLRYIILTVIIVVIVFTLVGIYNESKIKRSSNDENTIQLVQQQQEVYNEEIENKKESLELVQKEYKGYKVSAKLKIDKLNINTCVLDDFTDEAMNICVTKFYGPEANEVGNFCITGHNYITKNMFGYLYKLKTGETFTITDNYHGTVKYKIYDMYRAKENETYRIIAKN